MVDTVSEQLVHADIHDLKRGYVEDPDLETYTCLICVVTSGFEA